MSSKRRHRHHESGDEDGEWTTAHPPPPYTPPPAESAVPTVVVMQDEEENTRISIWRMFSLVGFVAIMVAVGILAVFSALSYTEMRDTGSEIDSLALRARILTALLGTADEGHSFTFYANSIIIYSNETYTPGDDKRRKRSHTTSHTDESQQYVAALAFRNRSSEEEYASVRVWKDRSSAATILDIGLQPDNTSGYYFANADVCTSETAFGGLRQVSRFVEGCPRFRHGVNLRDPQCDLHVSETLCVEGTLTACSGVNICDKLTELEAAIGEGGGGSGINGTNGRDGVNGSNGVNGTDGVHCWDLNGNGVCNLGSEDVNGDGACNVTDCRGVDGADGVDGVDGVDGADGADGLPCWDLNGNGVCNLGSEDNNGDGACNVTDCRGIDGVDGANGTDGASCWDLNQNHACDLGSEDINSDGACNVTDCRGTTGAQGAAGAAGATGATGQRGRDTLIKVMLSNTPLTAAYVHGDFSLTQTWSDWAYVAHTTYNPKNVSRLLVTATVPLQWGGGGLAGVGMCIVDEVNTIAKSCSVLAVDPGYATYFVARYTELVALSDNTLRNYSIRVASSSGGNMYVNSATLGGNTFNGISVMQTHLTIEEFPLSWAGEACTYGHECYTEACYDSVCACIDDTTCAAGTVCDLENTEHKCVACTSGGNLNVNDYDDCAESRCVSSTGCQNLGTGASCYQSSQCDSSNTCSGGDAKVCKLKNGQSCVSNGQCASNNCAGGTTCA